MTKEQAIEKHRNMWHWIAEQYKMGSYDDVITLKEKYLRMSGEEAYNYCYCCQYAYDRYSGTMCDMCPVDWGSDVKNMKCIDRDWYRDDQGLYGQICNCWNRLSVGNEKYRKKLIELAMQIAELPEKEDV